MDAYTFNGLGKQKQKQKTKARAQLCMFMIGLLRKKFKHYHTCIAS